MADIKKIDYSTKDYEGYKQDMIAKIPTILPEWTDRSEADPGIAILELISYQLENQAYYNDRVANEALLPTSTQRKSVIDHCRLIDYELSWFTSAHQYQVFEIEPQLTDTIIPKGSQVGTVGSDVEESVIFETLDDLVIPAGKTGLEQDVGGKYLFQVEVQQGQSSMDEYIGTTTTTLPYQEFALNYTPILKDSIELYIEETNGKYLWTRVDDFINSSLTDTHYTVTMDEYDKVYVNFGNGISGKIPELYSKLTVNCVIGGGLEGNVGANSIVEFYEAIPGLVSTFNPFGPHVLGQDKESIEDAKVKAPASLKRLNRYVTLPDYEEGIIEDVPGILKAKAINNAGNVDLYLLPTTGDTVASTIKDSALVIIENKKVLFTNVTLKDPVFVAMDIAIDVSILANYDVEQVRYACQNVIQDLFTNESNDFGKQVTLADIFFTVKSVEGVNNLVINTPTTDTSITETQFLRLGTNTVLINGA